MTIDCVDIEHTRAEDAPLSRRRRAAAVISVSIIEENDFGNGETTAREVDGRRARAVHGWFENVRPSVEKARRTRENENSGANSIARAKVFR